MTMDDGSAQAPGIAVTPPLLFLGAMAVGLALQSARPHPIFAQAAPGLLTGGVLIALGLALSIAMILQFRRARTPVSPRRPARRLVVSGPYRFSRNPDYLGQALVHAGIALALNSFWVLVALVPALLVVRYAVIYREERYLQQQFGDEYRHYRRSVRRWL